MSKFLHFSYPKSLSGSIRDLRTKRPLYWEKLGQKKTIELANFTVKNVLAYQCFLRRRGVKRKKVRNFDDFKALPLVNKKNYLNKSKYIDLFPKDYINEITTISSTSGSTGEPFYFPRGEEQDKQYEYVAEVYLRNQFEIDKYRTLAINGFGLGIWIGGIFTYKVFNKIATKGYRLSIAPTGRNKDIFLQTFKKIASVYDQVVLMGYPPFIKDVVDEGLNFGINWKKHKLRIMTATEGFSEKFRDYLVNKTGIENALIDTLNIYGSVELGTMSHETPITILIRKIAESNKKIFNEIFPGVRIMPTLVQYYPHIVYFEQVKDEVVASGHGSSFPLIRYQFFDKGGVCTFDEMVSKLSDMGIDVIKEARKAGIKNSMFRLPFVYVHERSDFVVNLRGANIYPGNIRSALEEKQLESYVTGKFTMIKREDRYLNEYLEINIEMKKGVLKSKKLKKKLSKAIVDTLLKQNSEFMNMYTSESDKATPRVKLFTNEHPKYFSNDLVKQKWILK
jgi:phenylacetate-CoA ligase